MELFFLILSLAGLWLGAELAIRGALQIAEHFKISHVFLGLVVLAIGTDIPELFVIITAAIQRLQGIETSGLIIGETIGTSFGQIGLMLGIAGLFGAVQIARKKLFRDGLMLIFSVVLMFLVGIDGEISKTEGIILILIYLVYFCTLLREEKLFEKFRRPDKDLFWPFIFMGAGFALLYYASGTTIENALLLSEKWGVAQSLVGILLVGLGTSLPELATTITAVRKKAGTMAAGNLIGSTIFDLLFVLGVGSAISGFLVSRDLLCFDIPALLIMVLIVILLFCGNLSIRKKKALTLIALYAIYAAIKLASIFV